LQATFPVETVVAGKRAFAAYSLDGFSHPTISIAGRPLNKTWSLAAAIAYAGDTVIWLHHNPAAMGWRAGDRVAVAATAGLSVSSA